jgi:hypothetical protein
MSGRVAAEDEFVLLNRLETLRLKLWVDPRVLRREMLPGVGVVGSWSAAAGCGGGWLGFSAALALALGVEAGAASATAVESRRTDLAEAVG